MAKKKDLFRKGGQRSGGGRSSGVSPREKEEMIGKDRSLRRPGVTERER